MVLSTTPPILVVDDSHEVRALLREGFAAVGLRTSAVATVTEARAALARSRFAALVVDCDPADVEGLGLLEDIQTACATTPLVAISGDGSMKNRLRALRMGASDFVSKTDGCHFLVRRVCELTATGAVRQRGDGATPSRVLVVDDSATFRHALGAELARDGHDIIEAADAAEALELLAAQRVELAIVDVFMEGMDGIELSRRIRGAAAPRVTIMLLTGRENMATKARAEQAQVDDFLVKSRDLGALRLRVRRRLAERPASEPPRGAARATPPDESAAPLFDRIVAASGLSEMTGRVTLQRSIERLGLNIETLSSPEISHILPQLERTIALFLPADEVSGRIAAVRALAARPADHAPDHPG